jgi:predicted NAD/FAD-binding protein
MKIAIIGTGIAGNVAAYHLNKQHDITVFEANDYIGGHTHTHDIALEQDHHAIDTGFIVFNYKTYPHFTHLLKELGVEVQASNMSFSVKCEKSGLEYNGTTLNSLFAQRSNLIRPSFYRMINDILRFNKEAVSILNTEKASASLGTVLNQGGYSREFIEHYLIPMGAAIWSSHPDQMMHFPAGFFIRFFHNHGMLNIDDRPTWYVIKGGSREYVKKLTAPFAHRIRRNTPVKSITRYADHVKLSLKDGSIESFDQVFIASHSDEALNMLTDASALEKDILGAIPYQENEAILHTDDSVLPKRKLAWAAWNYHILPEYQDRVALTYNMNILQNLDSDSTICVTLNNSEAIKPSRIIKKITYHHPVFTPEGVLAQQRHAEINGVNRTYYCGAYWRFGFHEDGVVSALNAIQHFEEQNNAQLHLRRAS